MESADPAERTGSPLSDQITVQTQNLDWTLAHFSFVANVTTLEAECDIAYSPSMSVASCHALPQTALAFLGESAELLANYATFLADPGNEVTLLVNKEQQAIVSAAFDIVESQAQWQMVYRGIPEALDLGDAVELTENDIPAMQALAKAEKMQLQSFAKNPFEHGPAYGIWVRKKLLAMGTTNVHVPNAAQIGNIITRKEHNRRGYATQVVSALVQALEAQELCVFLMVTQENHEALRLFEGMGFVRERPMYLMRCVIQDVPEETET